MRVQMEERTSYSIFCPLWSGNSKYPRMHPILLPYFHSPQKISINKVDNHHILSPLFLPSPFGQIHSAVHYWRLWFPAPWSKGVLCFSGEGPLLCNLYCSYARLHVFPFFIPFFLLLCDTSPMSCPILSPFIFLIFHYQFMCGWGVFFFPLSNRALKSYTGHHKTSTI